MGVLLKDIQINTLREDNAFTERVNILTFLFMDINFTLIISKYKEISDFRNIVLILILVISFFFKKIIVILLGILFKLSDLARLTVFSLFI